MSLHSDRDAAHPNFVQIMNLTAFFFFEVGFHYRLISHDRSLEILLSLTVFIVK